VLAVARSTPHPFTELDSVTLVLYTRQLVAVMENRRLLARLKAANRELSTTQARLVESARLQTLGEVAARVAHDFNNILGALLGRVQLLQHSVPEPRIQTALGKMERLVAAGEATVKRLQEAARVRTEDPGQVHTLAGMVREVFAESETSLRNQTQIDNRKIIWHTRFKPTGQAVDPSPQLRSSLRQILADLAANAPEDSVVELHTERSEKADVLKIGLVPPRAEATQHWQWETLTGYQGLKEIIDQLDGELEYRSVSTGAQELHVRLGSPRRDTLRSPTSERKYRVLVVDDDSEVREVLEELLQADGHTVTAAADGAQALKAFEPEQHDIVFTDLGMPGISGWQVAEMVKREAPKTPVVLVTGWGAQIEAEKVRASSVDRVLTKPFQWFSVLEVLKDLGASRSV
jgi:CheY-like chemotaxis protein